MVLNFKYMYSMFPTAVLSTHFKRDPNLTSAENGVNILKALANDWVIINPDQEVPEEIQPSPVMTDSRTRFFCHGGDFDFSSVPKGTQILVIDYFANEQTWNDLTHLKNSEARDTIEVLYLQHDGIIGGEENDIVETIECIPNLKEIHYCGYYAQYEEALMKASPPNIKLVPIE